ncbi:MAG: PrgI family protein [Patescibacteria group bacterium]|nr:PrgI family protein [Patescibacteria group bacterium]MBU1870783.1 PrgI family protein [Patescibacteria group bacterium]
MLQFTVPQFIDVEDKIIGPITTRQFIILLAAGIFVAICYKIFDFSLFLFIAILNFMISGIFAFAKINGQSFHFFILNFIQTFKRPSLRVWSQINSDKNVEYKTEAQQQKQLAAPVVRRYSTSRLAELSLIVDTKGSYKEEAGVNEIKIEKRD